MIPFDFEYYKPASVAEAVQLFRELEHRGKTAAYFSGGTELITLGRLNLVKTDAVIDIKGIPETQELGFRQNWLVTGAAVPLTSIEEAGLFPLLSQTSREVADRTARNKITIGGNICGHIYYREAVLPFLLADSHAVVAGRDGVKRFPLHEEFNQILRLGRGELLVCLMTDSAYLHLPHISVKRRKQWDTGYPLVTVAALRKDSQIRLAVSGLCPFPFRSEDMELHINDKRLPVEARVNEALRGLPSPILDDVEGSAEFRIFVLRNMLLDIVMELEEEGDVRI